MMGGVGSKFHLDTKTGKIDVDMDYVARLVGKYIDQRIKYWDVRIETGIAEAVAAENGYFSGAGGGSGSTIGVRALGTRWGFNSSDIYKVSELRKVVKGLSKNASAQALRSSRFEIELAEVRSVEDSVPADCKVHPSGIDVEERIKMVTEISKRMFEIKVGYAPREIDKAVVSVGYSDESDYFVSSEGSRIKQDFVTTVGEVHASADAGNEMEFYEKIIGGRGGWEMLGRDKLESEGMDVAIVTRSLALYGKSPKEGKKTVIIDPQYARLHVHEIAGHPLEADRILGREGGWAGRAWWTDMVGKKVGSDLVNVVSDARPVEMNRGGYGTFKYDDEGVPAKRILNIENGVLKEFMHSRETAAMMGVDANGCAKASSANFIPLIRMTNTYYLPDHHGPNSLEEMAEGVIDGYVVIGDKIPSIDSMRYRWEIAAFYGYPITNSEIMWDQPIKNMSLMGVTPETFESVDMVGGEKTFQLLNVPNCGKGDPMQTKEVGNGGPFVRFKASVLKSG